MNIAKLMFMKKILLFIFCSIGFIFTHAQKVNSTPKFQPEIVTIPGQLVVTKDTVSIGGHKIDYTAITGYADLQNDTGKSVAKIFFIYYRKNNDRDNKRPVTFAFNGGPGSSSVWLHLGALGPRRVVASDGGQTPPPPYRVVDNGSSVLDRTD